jgi:hypothetical protein
MNSINLNPINLTLGPVQPATASSLSAAARVAPSTGPADNHASSLQDKFVSGAKGAAIGAGALGVTGAGLGTCLALLLGDVPVLSAAVPIGAVGAAIGAVVGGGRGVEKAEHGESGGKSPGLKDKFASGGKCAATGAAIAVSGFAALGGFLALTACNVPTGEVLRTLGAAGTLFGGLGAGVGFDYGWNHVGWNRTEQ